MGLTCAQEEWRSTMGNTGHKHLMLTGEWMKLLWCAERWTVEILSRSQSHLVKVEIWEGTRFAVTAERVLSRSARLETIPDLSPMVLKMPLWYAQVKSDVKLKLDFQKENESIIFFFKKTKMEIVSGPFTQSLNIGRRASSYMNKCRKLD